MKLLNQLAIATATFGIATAAMAANPIVGNWQTYEDGKPKATVKITQTGNTFTGKVVAGNTDKAKLQIGKTVITGLVADGGGKYSKGSITDPVKNKTYRLTATLSGNTLKLKGHLGPFSRTQTWKKK